MGLRIVGFDRGEDAYERFVERNLDAQGPEAASGSETSEKSEKSEKNEK
jgi:hypothetical protein